MSEKALKLLQDVLALPVEDRATMVTELLASLDGESDSDVQAAWASEIERRARLAMADPDGGTDWETVRDEISAELRELRAE